MSKSIFTLLLIVSISGPAWGWGKRGHEIIASLAAKILSQETQFRFLGNHDFDLGYYANVPDIVYRNLKKEISDGEAPLHFIDWNKTFEEVFETPENLPVSFAEYKSKMGDRYKVELGLAPWRISELVIFCRDRAANLTRENQGPLLVCLGVLSHYVGDLAQPLHVTDNYDGQATGQKGIHSFFETVVVDFLDPKLKVEVWNRLQKQYKDLSQKNLDSNQLVRYLIKQSNGHLDELLKIDKKSDRAKLKSTSLRFRKLVIDRILSGVAVTALIWKEILKPVTHFDSDKFYFFDGRPEYIPPQFLAEKRDEN